MFYSMYIFPPPIEPKLYNYTLHNFSNIVSQFTLPQRGTTLCTYFPLPWNQNSLLIPSPTLVLMCTNLHYPNLELHYAYISPLH